MGNLLLSRTYAPATPPPTQTYTTVIPGHAAFLIVCAHADLRYIGAELAGTGRRQHVAFRFEDPKGLGPEKVEEYHHSILREYSEAHKFLRTEIGRVIRAASVEVADDIQLVRL